MKLEGRKLTRSFYLRPTLEVAPALLGKTIVYRHPEGLLVAEIVEAEAYVGEDDPACHAAVGPTGRNRIMYEKGGHAYIYFIYGMYHCFNIVTEKAGFPAAVLIRGVKPVAGENIMAANSPPNSRILTNGPGKFCRAFGLTRDHNGLDLTGNRLYLIDRGNSPEKIMTTPRIGIKKGARRAWRFCVADSRFVSKP